MASRAENEGIPGAEALAASSAERPSLAPLVVPGDGLPWPDVQLPADVDPVVAPEDADATWRIHDRTHLELAVEYPVSDDDAGKAQYVWEAYFYLPRSLRIHPQTYSHDDIYRDMQSYVRFAVPAMTLEELAEVPARDLRPHLESGSPQAVRELRLFAGQLRASARGARARLRCLLDTEAPARIELAARTLAVRLHRVLAAFRAELPHARTSEAKVAARWVDEDISRVAETILANTSMRMKAAGHLGAAQTLGDAAVAEARYRAVHGHDGVGSAGADKRAIEHLEFRRHLLKRFTSSVLWLRRDISEGGRWTLNVLYAVAACLAMAFAIAAALYHGQDFRALGGMWSWALVVMLAYAGKDRIKATLQGFFSKQVRKHFPDRRWRLKDRESGRVVGMVAERSAFVDPSQVPADVRAVRNSTRQHALEEQARPERVLWHQKVCTLKAGHVHAVDRRFNNVTEIFRLDLAPWLVHTDDPKERIHFADPETRTIHSAMAPRVYNLGIVYRVRAKEDVDAPWRRVRVVIGRKGAKRIEPVV
tara:strand:+ start:302 stop:1909 length:1608 start_codon:yes stop_codon:yes gene_type:complete